MENICRRRLGSDFRNVFLIYKLIFGSQLFREPPGDLKDRTDCFFSFPEGPASKARPRYSKVKYRIITHPV